jgi:2-deoxy-D-gluconate 3-dehydrogenase
MSHLFDLTGQVALVTGANTGIGQGIALGLAEAGADIVAVGRSAPTETAEKVQAVGRALHAIPADLSSTAPIAGVVEEAWNAVGPIDILVNNAGTIRRADSLDFSEEDWDAVMDTNLKSAFFLSQAIARRWVGAGRGGKIINIASMLSFQGGIRVPSYTASKSGLAGLTRLLACEWAAKGINVNGIAPGYFATELNDALLKDAKFNSWIETRTPMGRWGQPEELGGAVVFLASEAARFVNGHILYVDGAFTATV